MTFRTAIKEFIFHCEYEKKLSEKTLKAYKTDLQQINETIVPNELLVNISKQHIKRFLESISNLKPKSIKRKVATLKALFNYLEYEDIISINPFRKMKIKIKESYSVRPVMDIFEIKKVYEKILNNKEKIDDKNSNAYFEAIRDIVVIELLFNTGARVSEISTLKSRNINLETGKIKILGKGRKERILQICNDESLAIMRYYFNFFQTKISLSGDWFLINRLNRKLSEQSIRNMVFKVSSEAGVTKHITPHIFRHTFATLLLEKDVDIKYIQSFLGHTSITTTQIYMHTNHIRQMEILTAKHPRMNFFMGF